MLWFLKMQNIDNYLLLQKNQICKMILNKIIKICKRVLISKNKLI